MDRSLLFTISIDTEIDKAPDWGISPQGTYRSVLEGIPDRLTPLFDRYGARPTYLLSPEVIEDAECVRSLRGLGDCELGTHLHGDVIEPGCRIKVLRYERTSDMQCSYPREVEEAKMENLTALFERTFGYSPRSFRAGRFGAGCNTIGILQKLGYLVDSSVTPGLRWDYPEGKADFTTAPEQPYFPLERDLTQPGPSTVLEVPVSIARNWVGCRLRSRKAFSGGRLGWAVNVAFPNRWVRPSNTTTRRMIKAIRLLSRRGEAAGPRCINMMFHSMEVIPNASPVTSTELEVSALLGRMEEVLQAVSKEGYTFTTLSELYPHFQDVR